MSKDFLKLDGAKYRSLATGPMTHMEARSFTADLSERLQSRLADCSAVLVQVRCPKKSCAGIIAEVAGNPRGGALVATAYDRGPEPVVRTGAARTMGVLEPKVKAPDRDLALFWLVEELPDRWPLRCTRCSLRSEVAADEIAADVAKAVAAGDTITRGASRTR